MATRTDDGSLRDADVGTDCDLFMVDEPNFLTNPAVISNFQLPREMNADTSLNEYISANFTAESPQKENSKCR